MEKALSSVRLPSVLVTVVALTPVVVIFAWRRLTRPTIGATSFLNAKCGVKERAPFARNVEAAKGLRVLTPATVATITAICDTFIPSFLPDQVEHWARAFMKDLTGSHDLHDLLSDPSFFTWGAHDAGVGPKVCKLLEEIVALDQLQQLVVVLRAMEYPLGLALVTGGGVFGKFSHLPFEKRHKAIRCMLQSRIEPIRTVAMSFKAMTGRVYFGEVDPKTRTNPVWKALHYEDRTPATVAKLNGSGKNGGAKRLKTDNPNLVNINQAPGVDVREVECDVLVIGSGAGGGIAAGVLATAGLKVVVLEKGPYLTEKDFAGFTECEGFDTAYDGKGMLTTETMSVAVLAGSCVGGGTTVNWCASFRTPPHVRDEWANQLGLKSFTAPCYEEAMSCVCQRLGVNNQHSHRNNDCPAVEDLVVNDNNEMLWQSAKGVGTSCHAIARNVVGCKDCRGCERGCPYGAKQTTTLTFLEDASASGNLKLYDNCQTDRVINQEGKAVGALATVKKPDGGEFKLLVYAKSAVVVSCGSVQTPALLLRSQFKHHKIGRHLALHPVSAVGGLFPGKDFGHERGVGMGTYVKEFLNMDGKGYGGVIETPPSHPGLSGTIVPWNSAFSYRMMCLLKRSMALIIPIVRDRSSPYNRVTIDRDGRPRIHYTLTPTDEKLAVKFSTEMLKMMKSLKPVMAMPVHEGWNAYKTWDDKNTSFEDYIKYVEAMGLPGGGSQIFSAHQMSSCRMSKDKDQGVVDEDGQCWEVKGLYIMDGSVLPTSLGVNPMITIQSTAFMLAKRLAIKLRPEGKAAIEKAYLPGTTLVGEA